MRFSEAPVAVVPEVNRANTSEGYYGKVLWQCHGSRLTHLHFLFWTSSLKPANWDWVALKLNICLVTEATAHTSWNCIFFLSLSFCHKYHDEPYMDGKDQNAAGTEVSNWLRETGWHYLWEAPKYIFASSIHEAIMKLFLPNSTTTAFKALAF